eukprot:TRINITY_DN64572_c0_g1_i3.p1 TRINITY_DN64572_c0_g1~~TRINITY_DN64572_c0_g1_i3.p1  ORF type:complete len:181 (+),score=14.22 TRINITY_DN64572_c0_g1_i3:410-952(+)
MIPCWETLCEKKLFPVGVIVPCAVFPYLALVDINTDDMYLSYTHPRYLALYKAEHKASDVVDAVANGVALKHSPEPLHTIQWRTPPEVVAADVREALSQKECQILLDVKKEWEARGLQYSDSYNEVEEKAKLLPATMAGMDYGTRNHHPEKERTLYGRKEKGRYYWKLLQPEINHWLCGL